MTKLIRYLLLVLIAVTGLFGFSFHLEGNPESTQWLAEFGATPTSWLSFKWNVGDGLSATMNPNWTMASAFVCCALVAIYRWTGAKKSVGESKSE